MNQLIAIGLLATAFGSFAQSLFAQSYQEKLTTSSNMRMTVSNLGNVGNAFSGAFDVLLWPSCEYPAGSNIEHVFQGGLWIGAKVNAADIVVSTGAVDDVNGYNTGEAGYEFSANLNAQFTERSTLLDNPFYTPAAVSHQDFVSDFTDRNLTIPGTTILIDGIENGPLGADVHFEAYNWNFSFANFFTIINFKIKNNSPNVWNDLYIGYWLDPVIRNVAITPAGSGGTNFYNKGGTGWIDSLYAAYEFDAAGDVGFTDSYLALKYLGSESNNRFLHPAVDTTFRVLFNSWGFREFVGNNRTPVNDAERYARLTTGINEDPNYATVWENLLRAQGNRSFFMSAGPYVSLNPGEEVTIAFAVVPAKKFPDGQPNSANTAAQRQNLINNLSWAQSTYNGEDVNFNGVLDSGEDADQNGRITRYILPSPPDLPRLRVEADTNTIQVYWTDNSVLSVDPISQRRDFEGFRIYKTQVGFDIQDQQDIANSLKLVAQFDSLGNAFGLNNGFNRIQLAQAKRFEGDPNEYKFMYEFKGVLSGWQHAVSVTAFDQGEPSQNLESLESSRLTAMKRVFPGTRGNLGFRNGDPFVYPNPYYATAQWEGGSTGFEDRRIMFANLPPKCEVRVYTVAGDLVYAFSHDENYTGAETRWFQTYSDPNTTRFAGGEHGWDLLSTDNQIIARGLYIFAVKDSETGDIRQSKFVVIR